MVKLIAGLRKKSGMSDKDFHDYWRNVHGPLVLSVKEFVSHMRRYVQSHTVEGDVAFPSSVPPFDGCAEIYFDSAEDAVKAFKEPKYLELIRPDEAKFLDLAGCCIFMAEETVMKG